MSLHIVFDNNKFASFLSVRVCMCEREKEISKMPKMQKKII